MKQLFYNGVIITGEKDEVIENGYLVVENGVIIEVGSGNPLHALEEVNEKVDLHNNWVMPGLIILMGILVVLY
ncbi:hypothetical protein [Anaerobacillus sp. CMMVII]|uniref:hypothetical protein n=1 Tax=Anaerobacillus sp. CMMVII TaxID=2755588 RepID=UPI0021B846A3|nr:hypothetical protein [Anaerobacillus sp. CMMVII]